MSGRLVIPVSVFDRLTRRYGPEVVVAPQLVRRGDRWVIEAERVHEASLAAVRRAALAQQIAARN